MPRRKDIWRCGLIAEPISAILSKGRVDGAVHWLPNEPSFQFLADPFGWRDDDGVLHIFAEHYDYRTRHGIIEKLTLDSAMQVQSRQPCLKEAWHLSYPQIFAGEGAIWMLPEAHRSGTLTLYRDHGGLVDWRAECEIRLDCVPVDASIFWHQDRWWLFYSPATTKQSKQSHLHVAWADHLCGPWVTHPSNPVRIDRQSARPGGTPTIVDDRIALPVQDCADTYGGAIRPLWIDRLNEQEFHAEMGDRIPPPPSAAPYLDGMHSLTACGDITLFDVKRIDRSLGGLALDLKRLLGGYDRG